MWKPNSSAIQLIVVICVISVSWDRNASSQMHTNESKLTMLHYNDPEQVKELIQALQPGAVTCKLNEIFLGKGCQSPCVSLEEYMDALFKRVQYDLGMFLPHLRVNIRLLKDQQELNEAYSGIMRANSNPEFSVSQEQWTDKRPSAFYFRKTNTIYLQTARITLEILAHEMAHAVADHYFIIRIPENVGEIISRHVSRKISMEGLLLCISS